MSEIEMQAGVIPGENAEIIRYPVDEIRMLVAGRGDVQVADYTSTDRDGPPAHRHPWDEVEIVVEGAVEFEVDRVKASGGPGTVQLLPRGSAHSVRVPEGAARIIMVTIGAPYDGFAREMARLFAQGASLEEIAETAGRFGVELA